MSEEAKSDIERATIAGHHQGFEAGVAWAQAEIAKHVAEHAEAWDERYASSTAAVSGRGLAKDIREGAWKR